MKTLISLHEIKIDWKKAVDGLRQAEEALRRLECTHQANCIADILDAAMEAQNAINEQIVKVNDIESRLLFCGDALDVF